MVPSPRELVLFAHAFRLARRAQEMDRVPIPDLVVRLPRLRGLPREADPDDALRATLRATSRGARWFGWRGTCLVRALVLSALLADREGVELVIGVRPGTGPASIDGHAWVRLGGREIALEGAPAAAADAFVEMTALAVTAGPRRSRRSPR